MNDDLQDVHSMFRSRKQASAALAKGGLARIDDVEEPVLFLLHLIELSDRHRHGHHRLFIDQQEERLVRMELQTFANDLHDVGYGDVRRDQIFAMVEDWQAALALKALNDDGNLVGLLALDLLHHSHTFRQVLPLLERRHVAAGMRGARHRAAERGKYLWGLTQRKGRREDFGQGR